MGVIGVANYKSDISFPKFKMTNEKIKVQFMCLKLITREFLWSLNKLKSFLRLFQSFFKPKGLKINGMHLRIVFLKKSVLKKFGSFYF